MTVYNLNEGIGWASSGIEYAQMYRYQIFKNLDIPCKTIFTDFVWGDNMHDYTTNLGFADDDVLWLYQYFTDIPIAPSSYTIEQIFKDYGETAKLVEQNEKVARYDFHEQNFSMLVHWAHNGKPYVHFTEIISRGNLIRKDFYSFCRIFSEFFSPLNGQGIIHQRCFYNQDGSLALDERVDRSGGEEGEAKSSFRLGGLYFVRKEDFIAHFFKQLHFTKDDLFIIDRSTGMGRAIFEARGESRIIIPVHADHYAKEVTDEDTVLWNNYYEYLFEQAESVDYYVTSTTAQQKIMQAQFEHYAGMTPKFMTIPVGALDELRYPKAGRRPFSIVTASRYAAEKNLDWLVKAVAKAHEELPEISVDIYGEGPTRAIMEPLIEKLQAGDYIHIMGHHTMTERYRDYALYLTTSTSEGFGLSLMEAVGSGLGMIGFDVPYGNPTFIENEENGYLLDYVASKSIDEKVEAVAEKIVQYFKQDPEEREKMSAKSYEVAENYLLKNIQIGWQLLLNDLGITEYPSKKLEKLKKEVKW